jgi:MoaA/NifB/PqqE/SkfB family radical SAM enzyme
MSWARLARFRGRPRQVVVQLTDRCNARCPQCGMNVTRGGVRGDLDEAAARRIVDHCARLGVSALSFTAATLWPPTVVRGARLCRPRGIAYQRTGTTAGRSPVAEARISRSGERLGRNLVRSRCAILDQPGFRPTRPPRGGRGARVVEGIKRLCRSWPPTAFTRRQIGAQPFMGGSSPGRRP